MTRTNELVRTAVVGLLSQQSELPIARLLHGTAGSLGITKARMLKALEVMEYEGVIVRRVAFTHTGPQIRVSLAGLEACND